MNKKNSKMNKELKKLAVEWAQKKYQQIKDEQNAIIKVQNFIYAMTNLKLSEKDITE